MPTPLGVTLGIEAGTQGAAEAMEKGLPRQKAKSHLLQGSRPGLPLGNPAVGEQSHLQGALRDGYLSPQNPLVPGRPATRRQVH